MQLYYEGENYLSGGLGSIVSSPSRVQSRALADHILVLFQHEGVHLVTEM